MKEYVQVCARCVMDSQGGIDISFDKDGICNYCTDAFSRRKSEYFPNDKGKRYIDEVFSRIKQEGKDRDFDCVVGVSGGVDSSYILYLGHQYGLRMLAVHIDDGYDTDTAIKNIEDLCRVTNSELIKVRPDIKQFNDLTLSFFRAGVPNLAMPQDNVIFAMMQDTVRLRNIHYSLSGGNFSLESILGRGERDNVNACDKRHILAIQKRFGKGSVDKLHLATIWQRYIKYRYFSQVKYVYPLNYIDYRLDKALSDLYALSGFAYYGGKHWESMLTRFLQCYYLPKKFGIDKRKSHYSSLIVSGQMTRDEAIRKLEESSYPPGQLDKDKAILASNMGITMEEMDVIIERPACRHMDYPVSRWNSFASVARRMRRFLGS